MENKEWNPNDWQGKRREQVEYTQVVSGVFLLLLLFTILLSVFLF